VMTATDMDVGLEAPGNKPVQPGTAGAEEVRTPRYHTFRIPKPEAGVWTLKPAAPISPNAIVAIQNFDLQLLLDVPDAAVHGSPFEVKARLAAGEGGAMPDQAFLDRHRFLLDVKSPDGKVRTIELERGPNGVRVGRIPTPSAGTMEIRGRVEPGPLGAI